MRMRSLFCVVVAHLAITSADLSRYDGEIYKMKYSNIADAGGVTLSRSYEQCSTASAAKITFKTKKPFRTRDFNITVLSKTNYGFVFNIATSRRSQMRSKWVEFKYSVYMDQKKFVNHCQNGGECRNFGNTHGCNCVYPYRGELCTELIPKPVVVEVCTPNPCVKGYCTPSNTTGFKCDCFQGYTGRLCSEGVEAGVVKVDLRNANQTRLKITFRKCRSEKPIRVQLTVMGNPNSMRVTLNNTTKHGFEVQVNRKKRLRAKLKWTAFYRSEVFEKNPCVYDVKCTNSFDKHWCQCPSDYGGSYCEHERYTCYNRPCQNGGLCIYIENYETLCYCKEGFTGKYCSERINCTHQPCKNGGTCYGNGTFYSCHCPEGFTSRDCSTRVNCTKTTCKNGGRCNNTSEGVKCSCPPGMAGKYCTKRKVLPLDFSYDGCIGNNGRYKRNPTGPGFVCDCKPSYARSHCYDRYVDGKVNVTLDNAALNNKTIVVVYEDCHTDKAFWVDASFDKQIFDLFETTVTDIQTWGFTVLVTQLALLDVDWSKVETTLAWKAYLRDKSFKKNPCKNKGKCTNTEQGQQCTCPPRFTGPLCETEVQGCGVPCENGGTCVETEESFRCECPAQYGGKYCHLRAYTGTHDFRMSSSKKYERFEYILESCIRGSPVSVMVHLTNLVGRKKSAIITTKYSIFKGFKYVVERKSRKNRQENLQIMWQLLYDMDEHNNSHCQNGGKCYYETEYRKQCRCPPQYHGDHCQFHVVDCNSNPCENGATCLDDAEGVGYFCNCATGFSGKDCSYEFQLNGSIPATLTVANTASIAKFRKSFSVTYPECLHKPAGVVTTKLLRNGTIYPGISINVRENMIGGFRVKPAIENKYLIPGYNSGWNVHATIEWEAYTEPGLGSVCKNGGTCVNGKRSHKCLCPDGFQGDHCQLVDYCISEPCENGATCILTANGYTCKCVYGYFGHNCSYEIPQHLRIYNDVYPEEDPNNVLFTYQFAN